MTSRLSALEEEKKTGSRLSQLGVVTSPTLPTVPQGPSLGAQLKESVGAFGRGEVTTGEVISGLPEATKKVTGAFARTFVPAITNFFKTTGSIIGEGLAYAVDPEVRKQYKAGNLDILPTVSETTQADLAKDVIAAGIETAVYRSFPKIAKQKLGPRLGAGAIQGVGFGVAEGLANDRSAEEIIESLPFYGVSGSAINVLTPYLLPLLKAEMKLLPKEARSMFKGIQREITEKAAPGERALPVVSEAGEQTVPLQKPPTQVPEQVAVETRTTRINPDIAPVGTGPKQVSRLEARMQGVLNKVNQENLDELGLSTYNRMNKKEQTRLAAEFVSRDPQEALAVLKGEKPAPAGLLNESLAFALEKQATLSRDVPLIRKLASLRATRYGQEISYLTEVDPENVVAQLNDIIKVRKNAVVKKTGGEKVVSKKIKTLTKQATGELDKANLKVAEAEKLLKDLEC